MTNLCIQLNATWHDLTQLPRSLISIMPHIPEPDSSEADNIIKVASKPITAASDDSNLKKQARGKCRIYARCMHLSMLITASSSHRSENCSFYAKTGKWIRWCIDPTWDLSLSFWNDGLNINSKAATEKEGQQYLLDDKLSQM